MPQELCDGSFCYLCGNTNDLNRYLIENIGEVNICSACEEDYLCQGIIELEDRYFIKIEEAAKTATKECTDKEMANY